MKRLGYPLLLCGLLLLTVVPAASADGIIIPEPPPTPWPTPVPYLTIRYHRVTVDIEDQVATTRIDQVFVNESRHEVEGVYVFPLPEEAAISRFSMWVDGKELEGRLLDRDEARRLYEEVVRQRKDPALLEYIGRNAFQARIFPIPPGGERRIQIEYTEVLPMEGGLVRYLYPLDTERFSPKPLEEVAIEVTIRASHPIKAVYSPSHEVEVEREGERQALVSYEESQVLPDRDFELYYSFSEEDLGAGLLSYKRPGEDGFFLLLVAPKMEVEEEEVVAKDVLLVLDTSGSMKGDKIEQAKGALEFVLRRLNDEDRFNIVAFSSGIRLYADGLRPAEEADEALSFVRGLEARGGTNIHRALLTALEQAGEERPTFIIFLTDGLPTVGETEVETILEHVKQQAPEGVRFFAFGVGYDVNTILLDTLAKDHRGATVYVHPGEDIEEEVSELYAKISTPLLSDISLDFGPIKVEDIYPDPLPDLFAGSQLMVVGRYREGGETSVTLRGIAGGQERRFVYHDLTFEREGGHEFIARLWATRRIGYLLTQIRLHGEERELVEEIVDLSIRYGIITPYTSFLVDEREEVLGEAARKGIVQEQLRILSAPAPAYGAKAVEKSVVQEGLRRADRATPPSTEVVRHVGDKTFVLREGVWMDTTYQPDRMKPVKVSFGSQAYFQLLAEHPEWGRYFALGKRLIVVLDGKAYQVEETPDALQASPTPTPSSKERSQTPYQLAALVEWLRRLLDRIRLE